PAAPPRARERQRPPRRARRPHPAARLAPPRRRLRAAGRLPLLAHRRGERRLRARRGVDRRARDARARRRGGGGRGGELAGGARDRPRRTRGDTLRRPAPAPRARAGARGGAAAPRPRRRARRRRRGDRARDPPRALRRAARADDARRGAPAEHGARRRPDRRPRPRARRRDGRPSLAPRRRRPLRRALRDPGARARARGRRVSAGGVRGSLGRLWPFVRPHRRALLAVAGLAPVVELAGLVQPSLLKRAVDHALAAGDAAGLDRLALAFLAALGVELAAAAGVQYATAAVAQRTVRDLRQALFGRLVRRPMAVVEREPVGTTIARLTTDVEALQELFAAGAVTIVLDGLRVVGTAGAMLWLDARLALVSLALVPAALAAIAAFRRAAPAAYRAVRDRTAALGGVVQETLAGMRVVALSRREAATVAEHAAASGAQRDATLAAGRLEVRLFATMEALAT